MQYKALVAFATALLMILSALPLSSADSAPEGNEFSTGFYWESNELNKDKYEQIYGEDVFRSVTSNLLDSMFVADYDSWGSIFETFNVKEADSLCYTLFSYEEKGYYETEVECFYGLSGHVKVVLKPDVISDGKKLFNLEKAEVTGELKSLIESATVDQNTEITFEGDISFAMYSEVYSTYILNKNGSYICNAYDEDYTYYLGFENAKVTNKTGSVSCTVSLSDETCYTHIDSYYAIKDPSEEGMRNVVVGDQIGYKCVSHNTWDDWGLTVNMDGKSANIASYSDTVHNDEGDLKLGSYFITESALKSKSLVYGNWFVGMGGDVTATEKFLKENGHFESGYECGKYYCNLIYNDYLTGDKDYSKYVESKIGKSGGDNTMLYVVSAIAVILLIALIALVVMNKKKTA